MPQHTKNKPVHKGRSKGFVPLYRAIQDHWIWSDPQTFRAWCDILLTAQHGIYKYRFKGLNIILEPGQMVFSFRAYSKRWGWTLGKTQRFINRLRAETLVDTVSDTRLTVLTVCNYKKLYTLLPPSDTPIDTQNNHIYNNHKYTHTVGEGRSLIGKNGTPSQPDADSDLLDGLEEALAGWSPDDGEVH